MTRRPNPPKPRGRRRPAQSQSIIDYEQRRREAQAAVREALAIMDESIEEVRTPH